MFQIKKRQSRLFFDLVRVTGVEPARLAALDPKSSASANFAIPAQKELYPFLSPESILFLNLSYFFFLIMMKTAKPITPIVPKIA